MWLRQIKIGSRLITAFGLLGLVLLLQGLMSLQTMSSMRVSSEEIEKNTLPTLVTLSNINLNVMRATGRDHTLLTVGNFFVSA